MKVKDIMTQAVEHVSSTESIADAAAMMGNRDIGALCVIDEGKLVGIVTDRDIAVRGMAHGWHGGSPVLQVMSREVQTCREDDQVDDALELMANEQVRRMPVCAEDGSVVGIFSIGDAARYDKDKEEVTATLRDICRPSALHSQTVTLT